MGTGYAIRPGPRECILLILADGRPNRFRAGEGCECTLRPVGATARPSSPWSLGQGGVGVRVGSAILKSSINCDYLDEELAVFGSRSL